MRHPYPTPMTFSHRSALVGEDPIGLLGHHSFEVPLGRPSCPGDELVPSLTDDLHVLFGGRLATVWSEIEGGMKEGVDRGCERQKGGVYQGGEAGEAGVKVGWRGLGHGLLSGRRYGRVSAA